MRPTHTIEDYLMAMHVLERDHGEIVAARLAEMLGVYPATVAMTLKRMERDHWISGKSRKMIQLTESGRAAAHSVVRRHMLVEWLLVKVFHLPVLETHSEAHALEHAISATLETRMCQILGDPQLCPHGNPFPGYEYLTENWQPLIKLDPGDQATLRRIHETMEDDLEILEFLKTNILEPGVEIQIDEVLPFNQTVSITTQGRQVTLGYKIAMNIFAEKK
jgi:DtxR family Mn-dependent transcriptional regulator